MRLHRSRGAFCSVAGMALIVTIIAVMVHAEEGISAITNNGLDVIAGGLYKDGSSLTTIEVEPARAIAAMTGEGTVALDHVHKDDVTLNVMKVSAAGDDAIVASVTGRNEEAAEDEKLKGAIQDSVGVELSIKPSVNPSVMVQQLTGDTAPVLLENKQIDAKVENEEQRQTKGDNEALTENENGPGQEDNSMLQVDEESASVRSWSQQEIDVLKQQIKEEVMKEIKADLEKAEKAKKDREMMMEKEMLAKAAKEAAIAQESRLRQQQEAAKRRKEKAIREQEAAGTATALARKRDLEETKAMEELTQRVRKSLTRPLPRANADGTYPDLPEGFHGVTDSTSVAVASHHTCALEYRPDVEIGGAVRCWGKNEFGQCNAPEGIFVQLTAGQGHTCGIKVDQTLACWGFNNFAPAGLFQQVNAGSRHTCALTLDGHAICWGDNVSGNLKPPENERFVQVVAGGDMSCAIRPNGTVACWGVNSRGQSSPPPDVRFKQIAASSTAHVCGITAEGADIECWGRNGFGEGSRKAGPFSQVTAGQWTTCGIKAVDGRFECWGARGITAKEMGDDGVYEELCTSDHHTCGITIEGELRCWGIAPAEILNVPADFLVA